MKRGFTLVELVVVLAIIGISMGLFYSVLVVNWISLEKQVSLVDLQMEADKIIEAISSDGRMANLVTVSAGGKGVTYSFPSVFGSGVNPVTYAFTAEGEIRKSVAGNSYVISQNLDFNNCSFRKEGDAVVTNLMLVDSVFGQRLELAVSSQVFPRNL